MDKEWATCRLGGSEEKAAGWLKMSTAVYRQWPEQLHPVQADRIYAAIFRKQTAKALGLNARQFFANIMGESVVESTLTNVSYAAVVCSLSPHGIPPEYAQHADERERKRAPRIPRNTDTQAESATAG